MRALDLELASRSRRGDMVAYLLAAAAIAFAAHSVFQYQTLRGEVAQREARLAGMAQGGGAESRTPVRPMDPEAYSAAAETVRRLATPWDRLFDALEAARTERVALVALEPDPERGTLLITGEAGDYLAALTYLARLSDQKPLTRLHLVQHEVRRTPQPSVAFTISADWKGQR